MPRALLMTAERERRAPKTYHTFPGFIPSAAIEQHGLENRPPKSPTWDSAEGVFFFFLILQSEFWREGSVRNVLRAVSQLLLGTLATQRSAVGCQPNGTKAGETCGV